jgi:hypothetical protein
MCEGFLYRPAAGSDRMIRIAITAEAFEAIASTLALGSVGYENKIDEHGNRRIWLDRAMVDRLRSCGARAKATAMSFWDWRRRRHRRRGRR